MTTLFWTFVAVNNKAILEYIFAKTVPKNELEKTKPPEIGQKELNFVFKPRILAQKYTKNLS